MSGGRGGAIVLDSLKSAAAWRLGRRRHFSSRDKDGGHTIWSTVAENPLLYANFMTLSYNYTSDVIAD